VRDDPTAETVRPRRRAGSSTVTSRGVRRIDISLPLGPTTPRFPGDPAVGSRRVRSVARGDPYDLSALRLGSHAGTHVDAPAHFFADGASVDRLDLDRLCGPAQVVRVPPGAREVGATELSDVPPGTRRILLRTANSERWARSLSFFPDFVGLSLVGARRLLALGVELVGIDSLSVESDPTDRFPVHRLLLGRGVPILEGLLLADVPAGSYELDCLPLRWTDGDGAPARAVLRPSGSTSARRRPNGD